MLRFSGDPFASLRRYVAAFLIWVFLIQAVLRLVLLVPFHGLGRLSPVVHGLALILVIGFSAGALLAAKGHRIRQLLVAVFLGILWLVMTVYDVGAFAAGWFRSRPWSLDAIAYYYCEGRRWVVCLPDHPDLLGLAVAVAVAMTCLLFLCADAIAERLEPVASGLDRMIRARLGFTIRTALVALTGSYLLAWLVAPSFMAAREPSVTLLAPVKIDNGPEELVKIERPDFHVKATPGIRPRTLVLITVDSLRPDFVGLKPGQATLTPFLAALAQSGKLRDIGPGEAVCAASYCGIVALQSSQTWGSMQRGPPLMLADVLAANGYQSHFLLSGLHLTLANLGKLYGPHVTTLLDDNSPGSSMLADDREQIGRLERLPIVAPERSYISIHLMSAHSAGLRFDDGDGAMFKRYSDRSAAYRTQYSDGVRQSDDVIRQLFAVLKRKGLLANALVIITSDHGERMHMPSHGGEPDLDTAPIPLLVYESHPADWPDHKLASQADVAPTLLDAIGIRIPEGWSGHSLLRTNQRRASAVDGLEVAGMVAFVNSRKVLYRCLKTTGATSVTAFSGAQLTGDEVNRAMLEAPALYADLPKRLDAERCFNPPAAAPPRS